MEQTTIEETLEDIRAEANYERSGLLTVHDTVNMITKLVGVIKEINDRTKQTNKFFPGDMSRARVNHHAISDGKRLQDTNTERYYTITQQREHIDVLEANLKASGERNADQAYVIRNRINSFAEGVFSKALEEDIEVLKEELAVRTADSNMLGEIVDVVKMWDTDTCRANDYALLYIYNMLEDRIRNTVQEDL